MTPGAPGLALALSTGDGFQVRYRLTSGRPGIIPAVHLALIAEAYGITVASREQPKPLGVTNA